MKVSEIRVDGDVAYVALGKGKVAVIDAADKVLVEGINWYAALQYKVYYAISASKVGGKRLTPSMHRLIMGEPVGKAIDHIDGDGLNNRRCNLRLASVAENSRNTGKKATNTSGFKGVSWRADRQKWQVHIRTGGRRLSLGHFSDLQDAARAYAVACAKYHGEFAPHEVADQINPLKSKESAA